MAAAAAAASTQMDTIQRLVVGGTAGVAEVEVILGEVVGLMNIFPVGEGEVLLTMGQVSVMNVAIIALVMAG